MSQYGDSFERPPRSPSGDLGADHSRDAGAVAPGKRTATERLPGTDPVTANLNALRIAEAALKTITARDVPAMLAAIAARHMNEARSAGRELAAALGRIERQLESVRRWALMSGRNGAFALLAPLQAELAAIRAEAAPALALVPPAAPPIAIGAAFLPVDEDWAAYDEAEAANQASWEARVEAAETPASEPGQLIEAADRFGNAGGVPVPGGLRGRLEAAAGTSLTSVRLHDGPAAHSLAASYDARAVTIGQDVHFADGELDPDAEDGLLLIAHEVAHTIQQRSSAATPACKLATTSGADPAEVEADRFAASVVGGGPRVAIHETLGHVAALKRTPDVDLDRQPAPLVVTPDRIEFPKTGVGTESVAQTVIVGNAGDSPVSLEDVAVSPKKLAGVFPTYAATINDPIEAGGSVELQFAFRPSDVGPQSAAYSIITDGGVRSGGVYLEGTAFSNERSEVARLDVSTTKLKLPSTEIGQESAPTTIELTNNGTQPVTIEGLDIQPKRRTEKSEFAVYGTGGSAIEPGETIQLHVAFKPEKKGLRVANLVVMGNQGATLATVRVRGKGLEAKAARFQDALRGEARPTPTYADMFAALQAAQMLTEKGDEESYGHAHDALDPVVARLEGLAPKMYDILRDYDAATVAGLTMFSQAHWAVKEWWYKLALGSSINTDHYLSAFRAGEEEIKLGTKEIEESADLRAFQEASVTTAKVTAIVAAAAVALPFAVELAPILLSEAALLWQSAQWISARLAVWALTNPEAALALAEILIGIGIQIEEEGWESFADQFESPEGVFFFLMQVLTDAGTLAQASDGVVTPRRTHDGSDDVAPPKPRQPDTDDGASVPATGKGKASSELSPEAAEAAAAVVGKAKKAVEEIEVAVEGGSKATRSDATAPDATGIAETRQRVLDLDADEGARLIEEYGEKLDEYLCYHPLTNLEDLKSELGRSRARLRGRVDGFYEDVDSEDAPTGWSYDTTESIDPVTGAKLIETWVTGPNGEKGYFERGYHEATQQLELRMAFLKMAGQDVGIPGIVKQQGDATEMLAGKGSPTVQHVTMYQMKRLGVPTGWGSEPPIKSIHMSDIQNVATVVHLHWLRKNAGGENLDARSLLSVHTASVEYAETTAVQTGYTFAGPPVITKGSDVEISWLLDFQEAGNAKRVAENDLILAKYGYKRDTKMLIGFDIDIPVRPTP